MNLRARAVRNGAFALGAMTTALVIMACGSSSGSSSSSAAGAASSSSGSASASAGGGRFGTPAQRAKLAACLKQRGVTLPSRPPGGGPPSGSGSGTPPAGGPGGGRGGFFGGGPGGNPKLRAAMQACGVNFGGRVNAAARKAQVTRFVTCVNQHGYQLPKPNLSGKGSVFPSRIQSAPAFQKASRACATLLRPPAGAPGAAGGSSGAGPAAANA
jgi:hypothetical protein